MKLVNVYIYIYIYAHLQAMKHHSPLSWIRLTLSMRKRERERDRESLNNVYQTKLQTLSSNLCCISSHLWHFLAYFLIFYPLHHLLFQSDLPPPETTVQVLIENHTFAISPPLPPPYALVNDYCSQSSDPEPKFCLATHSRKSCQPSMPRTWPNSPES